MARNPRARKALPQRSFAAQSSRLSETRPTLTERHNAQNRGLLCCPCAHTIHTMICSTTPRLPLRLPPHTISAGSALLLAGAGKSATFQPTACRYGIPYTAPTHPKRHVCSVCSVQCSVPLIDGRDVLRGPELDCPVVRHGGEQVVAGWRHVRPHDLALVPSQRLEQ